MSDKPKERTEAETVRYRDEVLRRMLNTRPKPRESMTRKLPRAQRKTQKPSK